MRHYTLLTHRGNTIAVTVAGRVSLRGRRRRAPIHNQEQLIKRRARAGELDSSSVAVGETFTATTQVKNDGGQRGELTVTLEADGEALTSQTVTLASNESTEVDLTASIDEAGTYDITVNGNAIGTLEVTGEAETPETPEGTPTATPAGPVETDEGTPTAGATPTPTEAPGFFGPGFGVIVALLALLGVSLLALRRRD